MNQTADVLDGDDDVTTTTQQQQQQQQQLQQPTVVVRCAPSRNLNTGFLHFPTAKEMYEHLLKITEPGGEFVVRNFVGVIDDISIPASTVVTDLFPLGALEYYTKKNMGWDYTNEEATMWQLPERGGEQGDYRDGMIEKINNVVDCLRTEPYSKRAVIPIPFGTEPSKNITWTNQGQNKCCRELHLYLEDGMVKCTAQQLGNIPIGEYTHWITNLCHDRSATGC